jgi:hypothetical protein
MADIVISSKYIPCQDKSIHYIVSMACLMVNWLFYIYSGKCCENSCNINVTKFNSNWKPNIIVYCHLIDLYEKDIKYTSHDKSRIMYVYSYVSISNVIRRTWRNLHFTTLSHKTPHKSAKLLIHYSFHRLLTPITKLVWYRKTRVILTDLPTNLHIEIHCIHGILKP